MKACVEQTPGFELTGIKVIYADGIHAGETLLHLLGIKKTCRIILDHQHSLSGDIGSWPKFFGLHAWTTLLRRDCTGLVETFDESEYSDYLRRIRVNVQNHPKWSDYS
jgi:hypothetical protein